MHRKWLLSIIVVAGMALSLMWVANRAPAQNFDTDTAKYMMQAMVNLDVMVKAENKRGYQFARNSLVIGGVWMDKDRKYSTVLRFNAQPRKEYVIVTAGDNDTIDLDLQVMDENDNQIVADGRTNPTARVLFTVTRPREVFVRLRLYDSKEGVPCVCGFAMLEK